MPITLSGRLNYTRARLMFGFRWRLVLTRPCRNCGSMETETERLNFVSDELELMVPPEREISGQGRAETQPEPAAQWLCPRCGSWEYVLSQRLCVDRLFLRPPMARCLKCWNRFPHPAHKALSRKSVSSVGQIPAQENQEPGLGLILARLFRHTEDS